MLFIVSGNRKLEYQKSLNTNIKSEKNNHGTELEGSLKNLVQCYHQASLDLKPLSKC